MRDVTSASPAAIGVDVGTTNTKVVLASVAADGGVTTERVFSLPTPERGAALQEAVVAAIADVTAAAPRPIAAIGVASMAESGALTTPDGSPLGELLRWTDAHVPGHAEAAASLVAQAGAAELYAATGVPVPAKSPLVHWLRLRVFGDPRTERAHWAGAADLVVTALTGEAVTDHTLAARTMAYRLGEPAATFDADLLALIGLTPDRFPRVARPGEAAGVVRADVIDALAGVPVVVAGHDHAVGAWAAGVRSPGQAADSVGTAEALLRVGDEVPREGARLNGMSIARTVDGAHETLLAANPTAGAFVAWALEELLPPGAARDMVPQLGAETRDESRLGERSAAWRDDLQRQAEAVAASAAPLTSFVLPYLRGRQAPAPDPHATVRSIDGPPTLAGVLTGLALQLAWLDAAQTDLLGPRDPELRVLGGPGAANPAWRRVKERIMPGSLRPVVCAEPVATGAALLALRAADTIDPTTSLPLGSAAGSVHPAAAAGDPALLGAFIAAATQPEKEPA
ncbi:FGGY family carbohydrate kinase [Leifsonia sp. F6_8S_P_1B]|uniref:FGGY family carbohydrate kinase n=1 Tax=Leifsonia williamsii TaxID=3035919 RepID=A0ABT8K7F0_9MICO|nr:FGGY family carbohydrate kinase [Leifsonia williamsii]MDN4613359.1 FGGY family carbohydrate kinase [Leifsonia williamsii]